MERSDDALSELFLARECFLFDRNQEELSRTENSLGNIYFSRGHPRSAKSHYISGLQTAGSINNKHLQSSVLANIGLVEYDLGNFSKAMNYLNQSYLMNQMIKNHWTASVVGMALGKLQLRLGYFSKSMRIFREIMPIRQRKGNSSGIFEISSILAWICEIIGKSAAAGTYWNQTEKIQESELEPRSRFVGKLLRGMSNLFHCKFDTAYKLFDEMLEVARKRGASRLQCADCLQGLALSKFFQNRKTEALEFFKQALEHLGNDKDRFQYFQISYTASLLFPEQFKAIDFEKTIEKLIYSKIYDPLWVHFAPFLIANGSENAIKFLAFHVERLPHTALHKMEEIHPGLKDIIKIIQNKANRASQFVTLITPDETRTIHQDDYLKWRKKLPEDKLIFDGPAGTLIYNESKAIIKPGTIPHSILQQLFMAIPHPVEIESLYRSAWGMEFDPEFDFGAVKSSLQRLKSKLKRVVTAATLKRQKSAKGFKAVRLSVSVPWILVFR
jgi:tetratricopeptide (TPR) repeat protein